MKKLFVLLVTFMVAFNLPVNVNASTPIAVSDSIVGDTDSTSVSKSMDLKEVVVAQQVATQDKTKTTYSITKDMRKRLVDMDKIVSELPGFTYDYATRSLSYNNSKKIVVLVDSIEKDMNYLDTQHYRYSKVEVTPMPTGKYAGADVLINLVTKKNYEGYDGNVNTFWYMLPSKEDETFVANSNNGGYFAYTHNKLTMYVNGGYHHEAGNVFADRKKLYKQTGVLDEVVNNGEKNYSQKINRFNLYYSADYAFNKDNILSFVYNTNTGKTDNRNDYCFTRTINDGEPTLYDRIGEENLSSSLHSFATSYRGKIGENHIYTDFNYKLTHQGNKNEYSESNGYLNSVDFKDKMQFSRYHIYAYRNFFKEKLFVDAEYWNTWKKYTSNDRKTMNVLNENSYHRNYLGASFALNFPKFRFDAGGWFEHIRVKSMNKSETQVPCGWRSSIYYRMSEKNYVQLNYNSGISYPDKASSSSYGYFIDSLTWQGGNPDLKSSTSQNLTFHLDLWQCYNIRCGFNLMPNCFNNVDILRYGMLQSGEYGNYIANIPVNSKYRNYWVSTSFTKRFCKNFVYKFDLCYSDSRAEYDIYSQNGHQWNGSTSLNYYVPQWETTFYISYIYVKNIGITPQSRTQYNLDYATIHVEKNFFKRKLFVSVDYNPPFHVSNGCSESESDSPYKYTWLKYNHYERIKNAFMVNLKYRFSGGKSVRQTNKMLSDEL